MVPGASMSWRPGCLISPAVKSIATCTLQYLQKPLIHKSIIRDIAMVYDWDDKREACFRMYVQEKKTLEEIKEYFRQELGFAPR